MEIPGYKIIDTLGEGGMATVYLAIQQSFEREVALKVMSSQLSKDPSFGERFLREARIVSRLVHPNIVTVYDVGVHKGNHYLSMEYVPGEDLKQRRGSLTLAQILNLVKDVARALDYAGNKGYIHRDVKPENIMLHAEDGRAVLMDFGIARATDIGSGMTQTGTTMGTPHYMSPEQAKGVAVDPRSDIYSLGVVLFQLLAGRVPFDGDSAVAVGIMHVSESVPALPEYLALFQPIIDKALAKKPEARYQTGRELVDELDALDPEALVVAQEELAKVPVIDSVSDTDPTPFATPVVAARTVVSANDDATVTARTEDFRVSGDDSIGDYGYTPVAPSAVASRARGGLWLTLLLVIGGAAGWYFWPELEGHYQRLMSDANPLPTSTQLASPQAVASSEPSVSPNANSVAAVGNTQVPAAPDATRWDSSVSAGPAGVASSPVESSSLASSANTANGAPSDLLLTARMLRAQLERDPAQGVLLAQSYRQLLNSDDPADREAGAEGMAELEQWFDARFAAAIDAADVQTAREVMAIARQALPDEAREARYQALLAPLQASEWLAAKLADGERYLEQNALSSPDGANAVESYRDILQAYPDNAEAHAGLQAVVRRYQVLAQAAAQEGDTERALMLTERGLQLDAGDEALNKLRDRLSSVDAEIGPLMANARTQLAADRLISPKGDNAFASLQAVLAIEPEHQPALNALDELEQALIRRIDSMIRGGALDEASLQLASARDRFPQSQSLLTRRLQLEQLNEANLPTVTNFSVAAQPIEAVSAARDVVLVADRVIYLGFEYSKFTGDTGVVQASLFDGSRSTQIAQVPVIVTGASGVKFFRIERPVAGFSEGGYNVDLTLGDQRLATVAFRVVQ
ncbi:protein kinase domain-containing protein [Gilvimarinus japonicus]|uniref:Protein kinase n=1 Tax=Gilvimarinus japonicus TaxID=1796469 RepID=A0ABV7HS25_9GAMM